jgi:hypothetical protein
MTLSFHPEAEVEFTEPIDYYEGCELGLGYDFSLEVFNSIQNIVNYPNVWPVIEEDVRRCLVNRFPQDVKGDVKGTGALTSREGNWIKSKYGL